MGFCILPATYADGSGFLEHFGDFKLGCFPTDCLFPGRKASKCEIFLLYLGKKTHLNTENPQIGIRERQKKKQEYQSTDWISWRPSKETNIQGSPNLCQAENWEYYSTHQKLFASFWEVACSLLHHLVPSYALTWSGNLQLGRDAKIPFLYLQI